MRTIPTKLELYVLRRIIAFDMPWPLGRKSGAYSGALGRLKQMGLIVYQYENHDDRYPSWYQPTERGLEYAPR